VTLPLKRDSQQWLFDHVISETGKVFHFQGPGRGTLPPTVRQHDMISKHLGRIGVRLLEVGRAEQALEHNETALELFFEAANVFGNAQHTILATTEEKRLLHELSIQCYDQVRTLAPYRIERLEIPCPGGQVFANLHLAPGDTPAPCVIFVPGCDMTKEMYPNPISNPALARGMHIISIDGPGQGENNLTGWKLTADNTSAAISAVVDYLLTRSEVDPNRIGILGLSFGNQWAVQAAARDQRFAACAAPWVSFCDKRYLLDSESPRYKQLMAYLTGATSEAELDAIGAAMTIDDDVPNIECPVLMSVGEYDPRSPLDEVYRLVETMTCEWELWVHEDQHHITTPTGRVVASERGMWNIDTYSWALDWMRDRFSKIPMSSPNQVSYIANVGSGPNGTSAHQGSTWTEVYKTSRFMTMTDDA
jgi:dienelactone hydrolase